MNFEFKSTFKYLYRFCHRLRSIRLSWWIILVNITSATVIVVLYLTNHIIPATIGARPHGEMYLDLIELAIVVKAFATAFAVAEVVSAALPERSKIWIVRIASLVTARTMAILVTKAWQRINYTRILALMRVPFSSFKK
jgi:hypothetical protein